MFDSMRSGKYTAEELQAEAIYRMYLDGEVYERTQIIGGGEKKTILKFRKELLC